MDVRDIWEIKMLISNLAYVQMDESRLCFPANLLQG